MSKKNLTIGIVLSAACVMQVVILIKMNEIRTTVSLLSAKTIIEEVEKGTEFVSSTNSSMIKDTNCPISIIPENPETPYHDYATSAQVDSNYCKRTAYNSEGPSGVEGQIPPVYSDMSNIIGNRIKERE